MNKYESIHCPVCGKPFGKEDDIVVCPQCGAPYHRACYQEKGSCIFSELHEKGEDWQPPDAPSEPKEETPGGIRCPRCDTLNPPYGVFCQVCGTQLRAPEESPFYGPYGPNGRPVSTNREGQPPAPPFGGPGGPIPPEMSLNPFTNPFGGVAPDERIDEVPAKELAILVGRNTHYFLPRFKLLSQTGAKAINWCAFLFEGGYFLYRKMYGLGVFLILLNVLISLPTALITVQQMLSGGIQASVSGNAAIVNLICSALAWGMRFFCGFSANSFYFSHCKKKIAQERAIARSEDEYYAALSKKGSVAVKLIVGLLVGYGLLYFFSLFYVLFGLGGF